MKVVLFCGGMGLRLREFSMEIPKPMVPIGPRPIIWHLMKYYAHFGHKDFILCLGWHGNVIKDYFLNYDECVSNNFVLRRGDEVDLLDHVPSDTPGPQDLLGLMAQARAVKRCLGGLSGEQQQCIALAFYQGLSHAEVATHLRQPLGSVKSWVRRGLLSLKACLQRSAAMEF